MNTEDYLRKKIEDWEINHKDMNTSILKAELKGFLAGENSKEKKVLGIVDNFWEQGKKVRVENKCIKKCKGHPNLNIMEGIAVREFSFKQWEQLTQKIKGEEE